MATTISPNMGLVIPTVGVELGPQWATDLNASLSIIDQHNHSPGSGNQITPSGLNINSDLSFIVNNAINLRSVRFSPQITPINLPADLATLSVSGADLYYNDGVGNIIRITQSGSVAGASGSITGLVAPASATYVSGNQTFVWQSGVNTPANLDAASIILRNLVANSNGLTLAPPAAMATDYTITLPNLPAANSLMLIDSSGNITTISPNSLIPVSATIPFPGAGVPAGFLIADGSAVSRTTYAALFASIGTTYGPGNGTTTFNLPNATNKLTFDTFGTVIPPYVHSYWHMDSTGNEPNVVQVSGFDLTMQGTLPRVAGKLDDARGQFSTPNYLVWSSGASSATPYDSILFGIDGWFKTLQTGVLMVLFSKSNLASANNAGWSLYQTTGDLIRFELAGVSSVTSTTTYNDGNWHYYAAGVNATSGANNLRLYIDNTLVASAAGATRIADTADLLVGVLGNFAGFFQGYIDDISYWDTMPASWTDFETIIDSRWNSGNGNFLEGAVALPVPFIIKY